MNSPANVVVNLIPLIKAYGIVRTFQWVEAIELFYLVENHFPADRKSVRGFSCQSEKARCFEIAYTSG